jgi:serine/threonine-protein kinase ULK/ATG1
MATRYLVGDYVVVKKIGKGSSASVWQGYHKITHLPVAIKAVNRLKIPAKLLERIPGEIQIMKQLNHPNILRLYDVHTTEKHVYLILEYCGGGDLSQFIKQHGPLKEDAALHMFRQLASGLRYMYSMNLIHRDIKPQNLLLTVTNTYITLKIADFGFARELQNQDMTQTFCGSPIYMSPEILTGKPYNISTDLWSSGIVLYEMVTGKSPFMVNNIVQLIQHLQRAEIPLPVTLPCRNLINSLLQRDLKLRIKPIDFFRKLIPAYEPLKRNILEIELLVKIGDDYYRDEPCTHLGLYLKSIERLDIVSVRLSDEWFDIKSYLGVLRQTYLIKAFEIRNTIKSPTETIIVCVERRIYDLMLSVAIRGCNVEKQGRYKSLLASVNDINSAIKDYILAVKLVKILRVDVVSCAKDKSFLQNLERIIRARLGQS